ncbi:MAG: hypothetical protein QXU32_04855 [Nitrososphaerales archaeon]
MRTEHKEKEIFECYLTQGNIEVIVEVTITAQLYQDTVTRSIMKKTADVVTCVRLPDRATVLGCKAEKPSTDPIHVQKCIADRIFRDMNTANKGNLVKNVEAQKIVYLCDLDGFDKDVNGLPVTCNNNNQSEVNCFDPEKKVDEVVFTETWKNLAKLRETPPKDPFIKRIFESFRCIIKLDEAKVETCAFGSVAN